MDCWILAGQSNMEGVGLLSETRAEVTGGPPVRTLSSRGQWETAAEPLHRLWESFTPVHQAFRREGLAPEDRDLSDEQLALRERELGVSGAGLGISFGTAMAAATGREIGLIPAAHGGTTLEQWSPDGLARGGSSLYGGMIARVERARSTADVSLAGLLWYQGESDGSPADAATYAERFDRWVDAARRDLDAPDLPVYVVQLGRLALTPDQARTQPQEAEWQDAAGWDLVRDSQRTLPDRTPNTGVTSAIDLGLVDPIHIDTAGLGRLGRRLARLAASATRGPAVERVERLADAPNGLLRFRVACSGVEGGWTPAGALAGFTLHDEHGVHPRLAVVDARPAADDPRDIEIVASTSGTDAIGSDIRIAYGQGHDPVCLAVDAADMPLPAFAPQRVAATASR